MQHTETRYTDAELERLRTECAWLLDRGHDGQQFAAWLVKMLADEVAEWRAKVHDHALPDPDFEARVSAARTANLALYLEEPTSDRAQLMVVFERTVERLRRERSASMPSSPERAGATG